MWRFRKRLWRGGTAIPVLEKQLAQQRDLLTALTGGLPSQPISETFQLSGLHLPENSL